MLYRICRTLVSLYFGLLFFFFKQKTAYEMRISDWSSDVCSSDLAVDHRSGSGRTGEGCGPESGGGRCLRRLLRSCAATEGGGGDGVVRDPHGGRYGSCSGRGNIP